MKTALLVCVCALVAAAWAAPKYTRKTRLDAKLSEHVRVAEQAWTTAERESDPAKQPALWEQAAGAFAAVDGDPVDTKVKHDAAYAAILAWKNALAVEAPLPKAEPGKPRELPARELQLIAAIDRYVKYVADPDPELPGLVFMKAQTYARFDQLEIAVPMFRDIVTRFHKHEVAVVAAQLALDAYNRLGQFDQLVAFADELANDAAFLRGRKDLVATVTKIRRIAKRKHVEQLEVTARAGGDFESYTPIGTAYLELYNADPKGPDGDELLYNAGVAFETSHSISAAIQAFMQLQRTYPRSKLGSRALARLGRLYADTARFDMAAEKLEEYAAKFAGEKDAVDAMSDAVYFRKALGDRDKAIADTKYFVRTFGAKKPREAADAAWSLIALDDADPDRAIVHLRDYLHEHAAGGGPERRVIAFAKIGQLLWKQSCPVPGVDGLCVLADDHAARTCGAGTTMKLTAARRDERKAKDAQVAFASAIHEFERQSTSSDAASRYYYAQAKLAVADTELESLLSIGFPSGLNFGPDRDARALSMKRFDGWVEIKQRASAKAMRGYEAILAIKDAATSITAGERIGFTVLGFASSLVTGEIPRDVRTGAHAADKVKAYCDAMLEVAQPLEVTAVNDFGVCLAKSTELARFDESSRRCERELTRLKPEEFPRATELRSQPLEFAPVIAVEPATR